MAQFGEITGIHVHLNKSSENSDTTRMFPEKESLSSFDGVSRPMANSFRPYVSTGDEGKVMPRHVIIIYWARNNIP